MLLYSLFIHITNAQYKDVFDRVIRSRFNIQTNRRLDIDEVNPYNVYKVVQEGNFIFFIGDENGVFKKQDDKDIYYKAPDDPRFEECLRLVAEIYQKDVEFPYTVPIFINYKNCGGVAYCYSGRLKGVQEGESSTWAGLIIDIDIEKNYNVHYVLNEGESYDGLYLAEVIAHEIFHSVFWNAGDPEYKIYPYSWVSDGTYEYEPNRYKRYSDDLELVSDFYCGKNAMLANAGKPIQLYAGHFTNAFEYTDDKFFAFNHRKSIAVNHLGKISLGIMKDVGFLLKAGVDIKCDKFTGYLFDDTEQVWAHVSMGDTLFVLEDKWLEDGKYHTVWCQYSTSNERINNNNHLDVHTEKNKIVISNNGPEMTVYIYNMHGNMVDQKNVNTGNIEIQVKSPGVYIVKSDNYSKKVLCL